nr:ABC transporter F family member 4 [Ipomoea trifida]
MAFLATMLRRELLARPIIFYPGGGRERRNSVREKLEEKRGSKNKREEEKESEKAVKKAKSNTGTSQRTKKDKNNKDVAKENGGVAAKQAKVTKNEEKKVQVYVRRVPDEILVRFQ